MTCSTKVVLQQGPNITYIIKYKIKHSIQTKLKYTLSNRINNNLFIDGSIISVLTLRATWIHSHTRMASEKSCMTFSNTSKTL